MVDWKDIQSKIDFGRGKVAEKLGPPFDVYRIGDASTGNVLHASNRIYQGVKAFFRVAKNLKPAPHTDQRQGILWYEIQLDLSQFKVGDIFKLADPNYGAGHSAVTFSTADYMGFCVASHLPNNHGLGGRLDTEIKVYRNEKAPVAGSWKATIDGAKPLVLTTGTFALGNANATPSLIPAGIQALRPYGDRAIDNVPSMPRKSLWACYVPPLKGFAFRDGDRIVTPDGARFIVLIPESNEAGVCGSQLTLEREVDGVG